MRKYIVLKQIGDFPATVTRSFDSKEEAEQFARLLVSSETNERITYYTAENVVFHALFSKA